MTIRDVTKYLENEDFLEHPTRIFTLVLSRGEIRDVILGNEVEAFDDILDEAQGAVQEEPVYLVLKITK